MAKVKKGRRPLYKEAMTQVVQVPMTDKMKLDMQKIISGLDYPLTLPAAMRKAAQEWIDNRQQAAQP